MPTSLMDAVSTAMREVAAEAVLPRYCALKEGDIREKSPGDVVTIADKEAEQALGSRLLSILPGSRVVGEEAAADDPGILAGLDDGEVWLVDPLDGTRNFVDRDPHFAMMVALLTSGQTVAAWILHPVGDTMASAELGSGAYFNSARIVCSTTSPGAPLLEGLVMTGFLPARIKESVASRWRPPPDVTAEMRCAGHQYPRLIRGSHHFALYWRTLPWDHAPGVLLLAEAGGAAARPDGRPYRPADAGPGLLVAQNVAVWNDARELLFGADPLDLSAP